MRGRVNAIRTFKGLVADLRLTILFEDKLNLFQSLFYLCNDIVYTDIV